MKDVPFLKRSLQEFRFKKYSVEPKPRRFIMRTRQAVLHIPKPTETPLSHVFSQLKRLRPSERLWTMQYHPSRHAIIILATPSFANHLEAGSGFIPRLLKTINRHSPSGKPLKVDVVCGVVDGLPPRLEDLSQARRRPISEGFSVLYGETNNILPKYLNEKNDVVAKSEKPGSITFEGTRADGMSVTLPLANTLFKNGRLSTLLSSTWEANGDEYTQIEAQVNLNSVSVNNLEDASEKPPGLYVPAIPLTYARELQKGYGNIIRTLKFQGSDRVNYHPASAELETKVPSYLREVVGKATALKIWALSIPPHLVQASIDGSTSTLRLPDKDFKAKFPIEDYKEVGDWISRGATLCRVQSGGGGWGPKAGLLSLDPETTYSHTPESSIDMDDSFFKENDNHHLDDVAKPGSYIQFFTVRDSATRVPKQPPNEYSRSFKSSTVLGAIPSSIDSMDKNLTKEEEFEQWKNRQNLLINSNASRALHKKAIELLQVPFLGRGGAGEGNPPEVEGGEPHRSSSERGGIMNLHVPLSKGDVHLRFGEFGFVSESGMFVKQTREGKNDGKVESKIDIPFSYFYKTFEDESPEARKVESSQDS